LIEVKVQPYPYDFICSTMQGECRRGQSCKQKERWGQASRRWVKDDRQADCAIAHSSGQLQPGRHRAGNGPVSSVASVSERTPCRTIAPRNDEVSDLLASIARDATLSTRSARARSRSRLRFAPCISSTLFQICNGLYRRGFIRRCRGSNLRPARSRTSWPISRRSSNDAHRSELGCVLINHDCSPIR
jgi:hypothetical protein